MPATPSAQWEVLVSVDPSLDTEPDPESPCPKNAPTEVVAISRELLVGRRDDSHNIRPDIALNDPGCSRKHCKFVVNANGLELQDLGSTNGTMINDHTVQPNARVVLKNGDQITIGRWTKILVRGANSS
jgi:pSer/pThr/pTyr-binding forkhead associated (FHA) protein